MNEAIPKKLLGNIKIHKTNLLNELCSMETCLIKATMNY